jgi:outer membrane protein assembly factor BamB
MLKARTALVFVSVYSFIAAVDVSPALGEANWLQWRGPEGTGVAPDSDPPVDWSENKNVKWKVPIPGKGHATPIIWKDLVIVQTAVKTDKQVKKEETSEQEEQPRPGRRGQGAQDRRPDWQNMSEEERAEMRQRFQNRRNQQGEAETGESNARGGQGRRGGGDWQNMSEEEREKMRQRFRQQRNQEGGGRPGGARGREGRGPRGRGGRRGRWGGMSSKPTYVHRFSIMAVSRKDGSIVWEKIVREELPHEGAHRDGSLASGSPVTDGERIYAFFGSRGLYCFDMSGTPKWEKDLGDMKIRMGFGEGSSPVLTEDLVIVNWDHEGDSFVAAFDKTTGDERWRIPRDERTTWSTPLVVKSEGQTQVIVSGTNRIRSYDVRNGSMIWECGGMTQNVIPTPVHADGVVYLASGFRGNSMLAIKLDGASGDITDSDSILWRSDRDMPYVPSPLLYDGSIYLLKQNTGIISCLAATDGDENYGAQRLEGLEQVYASPVGASGRVYVVATNGKTAVLKHGPKVEVLSINALDDQFAASPAIVGGEIYLRGYKNLYCISSSGSDVKSLSSAAR